jgi:FtsZ-binding cell division protein ZapB
MTAMEHSQDATQEILNAFEGHARGMSAMLEILEDLVAAQADTVEVIERLSRELDVLKGTVGNRGDQSVNDGQQALRAQAAQTRRRATQLAQETGSACERSRSLMPPDAPLGGR